MKFGNVSQTIDDSVQSMTPAIYSQIVENNYFSKDEKRWSLTELLKGDGITFAIALCGLVGRDIKGQSTDDVTLCDGMKYKLKVLTRQACSLDKNGTKINGWDILAPDGTETEDIIRPQYGDEPKTGDVVKVKGNPLTLHPDTGEKLDQFAKRTLSRFGRDTHHYSTYVVDKDGCISVTLKHALQILKKNGQELVYPKFRKLNKVQPDGTYKDQRKVTNHHFKEVPPNYKKQQKQRAEQPTENIKEEV